MLLWYNSITSPQSIAAISAELQKSVTNADSANSLLAALIQDFAIDQYPSKALSSIVTSQPLLSKSKATTTKITLPKVQQLLGQLLQQVLEFIMSDWESGAFLTMADGGMLLNGTAAPITLLEERLAMQEKR